MGFTTTLPWPARLPDGPGWLADLDGSYLHGCYHRATLVSDPRDPNEWDVFTSGPIIVGPLRCVTVSASEATRSDDVPRDTTRRIYYWHAPSTSIPGGGDHAFCGAVLVTPEGDIRWRISVGDGLREECIIEAAAIGSAPALVGVWRDLPNIGAPRVLGLASYMRIGEDELAAMREQDR